MRKRMTKMKKRSSSMRLRDFLVVVPYKKASAGSKAIAKGLKVERINHPELIRGGHHVINWGNTKWRSPVAARIYNKPENLANAVNKLKAFRILEEARVPIPAYTTDKHQAEEWLRQKGTIVVCRRLLSASGGKGIVIAKNRVDIVDSPLYTRYVKKKREYRVHVFQGRIIGYKRKIKHRGVETSSDYVRSHSNGYRYIIDPEHPPSQSVLDAAVAACGALRLDFGGVDVMWVKKGDKSYVLEVNCAPGLTDMTGQWYIDAFKRKYRE